MTKTMMTKMIKNINKGKYDNEFENISVHSEYDGIDLEPYCQQDWEAVKECFMEFLNDFKQDEDFIKEVLEDYGDEIRSEGELFSLLFDETFPQMEAYDEMIELIVDNNKDNFVRFIEEKDMEYDDALDQLNYEYYMSR